MGCMRVRVFLSLLTLWCGFSAVAAAAAQSLEPRPGGLRVTVRDATPLPIAGASVTVTSATGPALDALTNDQGVAEFDALPPGRYRVAIESPGFEPAAIANITVRSGTRPSRDVQLAVAGILEEVNVLPAEMDRQLTDAFTTTLTEGDIDALPDDPEELALFLARFAGPDADIRIDGFSNSELPAGAQIQSVRIRYDDHYLRTAIADCTATVRAVGLNGSVFDSVLLDRCGASGEPDVVLTPRKRRIVPAAGSSRRTPRQPVDRGCATLTPPPRSFRPRSRSRRTTSR